MQKLVFSADVLVRFRAGRLLVHTTSSPLPAFESNQPALIGWLSRFARPMDPSQALNELAEPQRQPARQVLDYLTRAGVLIEADGAVAQPFSEADTRARTLEHLRLLARSVYDLSCDLYGLGPLAERELAQRSGVGVERRLLGLLSAVDNLRTELRALRAPFIAEQLQKLGVQSGQRDLKVHVGCGAGHLPDWINIDVWPAPLSLNVLWGLPFEDGSVRFAYLSHLLEHLFYPRDVSFVLGDLRRVLAPGGVVRIVVPDIAQAIEAYSHDDDSFFASRRETWKGWPSDMPRLAEVLMYAGVGIDPGWQFEAHKFAYDFSTLAQALERAGFIEIVRSEFQASEHPELLVDEISAVAKATYGGRHYSLFVEARRPPV